MGSVIVKCELFPTLILEFLRPQKMKLIRGGHFEQNLKKSPAYLHIVENFSKTLKISPAHVTPYREECDSKI